MTPTNNIAYETISVTTTGSAGSAAICSVPFCIQAYSIFLFNLSSP